MRYRLNNDKVFSDVTDGIAILIDMETGIYYGMNAFTTNVYENIAGGVNTDELLSALSALKGFDGEAEKRFESFVDDLLADEFIIEDPQATAAPHLGFSEYPNDEQDLVLSSYPEASELLLADPIHQVKAEQGWKPDREVLR